MKEYKALWAGAQAGRTWHSVMEMIRGAVESGAEKLVVEFRDFSSLNYAREQERLAARALWNSPGGMSYLSREREVYKQVCALVDKLEKETS